MIDQSAVVETQDVPASTKIWRWSHVREGVHVGDNCVIGQGVYVDRDVWIGNGVKIQNCANLYSPLTIEDSVFIGPGVIVCNDHLPRAWEWNSSKSPLTKICRGASIGAGSVILPGVCVGEFAMVGAGSVVVEDVPDNAVVVGNPAEVKTWVSQSLVLDERACR